jgi:flagellar biosynthesis/type III secretory pathway ATPase
LISIGAYRQGASPEVDAAIALREPIGRFLRQQAQEQSTVASACADLMQLAQQAKGID